MNFWVIWRPKIPQGGGGGREEGEEGEQEEEERRRAEEVRREGRWELRRRVVVEGGKEGRRERREYNIHPSSYLLKRLGGKLQKILKNKIKSIILIFFYIC